MQRLSEPTFRCGCGRDVEVRSSEIAAWRANDTLELWQIVDVMKALHARVDHEECRRDYAWALAVTAAIVERDESFVRMKYEEYLEWLEGR